MPQLPTSSQKSDSIQIGSNTSNQFAIGDGDDMTISGGKWEDEEERRFFEDVQDLKDFVPRSVLGLDEVDVSNTEQTEINETDKEEEDKEHIRQLEEELEKLATQGLDVTAAKAESNSTEDDGLEFQLLT